MKEFTRRGDDVEINIWGVKMNGPAKSLISILTSTFSILALIGLLIYHVILDIKYSEAILAAMNLQNAILIMPQADRGAYAHRLPPKVQEQFDMLEKR